MRVAVASDHAGFPIKDLVLLAVINAGHEPLDLGAFSTESVDYPDYAMKLASTIINGEAERGILLCGSGVGASIAANKFPGIYAAVCHDPYSAHQGVEHDSMNVLCLGGRIIGPDIVLELVPKFLNANFQGHENGEDRHFRRVKKIRKLEERFMLNNNEG